MRVLISPPVITKVPAKQPMSSNSSDLIVTASVNAELNGFSGSQRPTTSSSHQSQHNGTLVELMAVGSAEDLESVSSDSTDSTVRYGPGIVRRLAQKFATIAAANETSAKKSFNRQYRSRAASCDNLLNDTVDRFESGNGENSGGLDRKFSLSHSCIHTAEMNGGQRVAVDFIEKNVTVDFQLKMNGGQPLVSSEDSMAVLRMAQRFEPSFHIPPAKLTFANGNKFSAPLKSPTLGDYNLKSPQSIVSENQFELSPKLNGYVEPVNVSETIVSPHVPEFIKVSQHLRSVPMLQRRPSTRYTYKAAAEQVEKLEKVSNSGSGDNDMKSIEPKVNGVVNGVRGPSTNSPVVVSPPRLRQDSQLASYSLEKKEEMITKPSSFERHPRKPFQKSLSEDTSVVLTKTEEVVVSAVEQAEDASADTPKLSDILKKFGGSASSARLPKSASHNGDLKLEEKPENTIFTPEPIIVMNETPTSNDGIDIKEKTIEETAKSPVIGNTSTANKRAPSTASIDKAPQIKRKTLTSQHWLKKQAEAEALAKATPSQDPNATTNEINSDANGELFGVKLKKINKPVEVVFDSQKISATNDDYTAHRSSEDKKKNGSYSFVNSDSADLTPKEEFQQEAKMNFERRGSLDIAMPSTDIDQLISTIDDGNGGESDDDWAETDDIVAGPISSGNKLSRSNIAQGSGVELLSYSPADFDAKSADWSAYVGQNGMDINALLSMEEVNRRQISYDEDEDQLLEDIHTEPFHFEFVNSEILVNRGILSKTSKTVKANLEWSQEDPKAYAYELEEEAIVWDPGMELDMENYRKICQEIKDETAKKREQLMFLLEQEPSTFSQGGLARYTPNTLLFEQYNLGQNDTDVMITDDNLTGLRENRDGNNGLSDSHIPIRTLKAEQQDGLIQFPTEDQISVKPETQGPVWSNATCDSELLMF